MTIQQPTDSIRVFIVEDNDDLRLSLHWLLEGAGFQVRSWDSAEAFLTEANQQSDACLILDYRLPGMDGLTLLHSLPEPRPPAIMITAHGDANTAGRAKSAGVRVFIEKPVDPDTLVEVVRRNAVSP